MIKFDIRTKVLKDRGDAMEVRVAVTGTVMGESEVVENEIYSLLKDLETRCPEEYINALERVMTDALGRCKE